MSTGEAIAVAGAVALGFFVVYRLTAGPSSAAASGAATGVAGASPHNATTAVAVSNLLDTAGNIDAAIATQAGNAFHIPFAPILAKVNPFTLGRIGGAALGTGVHTLVTHPGTAVSAVGSAVHSVITLGGLL